MATRKSKAAAFTPIPAKRRATTADSVAVPDPPCEKLIREKFTLPEGEHRIIALLKERAARISHPARKGEIVRAGLKALQSMSDRSLARLLGTIPKLKRAKASKDVTKPLAGG